MTAHRGCVVLTLAVLDRMAAGCGTAYFGLLALSWTGGYRICCDTALWPSHFMSPLNFHSLNSCMKWHDTFSIPFSFFCLSSLLLSFVFWGFGFLFFKIGKTTNFCDVSLSITRTHKRKIQQSSVADSHAPICFSVALCSLSQRHSFQCPLKREIIQNKEVFPWLAFLICLTSLPLAQLSRCFCGCLHPALTASHLLKGLLIYSTLVTWGSAVARIYLTKYSPNEI